MRRSATTGSHTRGKRNRFLRVRVPTLIAVALAVNCTVPRFCDGERAGQCLQIVDPQEGHILAREDFAMLSFVLRVNCPGHGAALVP